MEIKELTPEQIEAINKANDTLKSVGLVILEIGAPKPPRP